MTAIATVTVKLSVELNDNWGDDCTLGQVKKQATDRTLNTLTRIFRNTEINLTSKIHSISIRHT